MSKDWPSPSISKVNVCSYLQLVALAENVRLELEDVSGLLRLSRGDVRRCLLQLQLWVRSGGGWTSQSGGLTKELVGVERKWLKNESQSSTHMDDVQINTDLQDFFQFPYLGSDVTKKRDDLDSKLPHCDTGCTASMLGLKPLTQNQVLNLLKVSIEKIHLINMNSLWFFSRGKLV